jgi:hypothetical protein
MFDRFCKSSICMRKLMKMATSCKGPQMSRTMTAAIARNHTPGATGVDLYTENDLVVMVEICSSGAVSVDEAKTKVVKGIREAIAAHKAQIDSYNAAPSAIERTKIEEIFSRSLLEIMDQFAQKKSDGDDDEGVLVIRHSNIPVVTAFLGLNDCVVGASFGQNTVHSVSSAGLSKITENPHLLDSFSIMLSDNTALVATSLGLQGMQAIEEAWTTDVISKRALAASDPTDTARILLDSVPVEFKKSCNAAVTSIRLAPVSLTATTRDNVTTLRAAGFISDKMAASEGLCLRFLALFDQIELNEGERLECLNASPIAKSLVLVANGTISGPDDRIWPKSNFFITPGFITDAHPPTIDSPVTANEPSRLLVLRRDVFEKTGELGDLPLTPTLMAVCKNLYRQLPMSART